VDVSNVCSGDILSSGHTVVVSRASSPLPRASSGGAEDSAVAVAVAVACSSSSRRSAMS
jgi:hypothetical protein